MTRKLVDMPTSNRLRSASSRCSASSRAERVVSMRLRVHLDLPRGVAHLLNRARLGALQALLGLRALEPRPRAVGVLAAPADRIRDADADRPGRVVVREQLVEHVAEGGDRAGADDRAREAAGAQNLRAAESARLIAGVQRARLAGADCRRT